MTAVDGIMPAAAIGFGSAQSRSTICGTVPSGSIMCRLAGDKGKIKGPVLECPMEFGLGVLTDLHMRGAGCGDGPWPNA